MASSPNETIFEDQENRLLSNLVFELNIARRHTTAYPDNHPIIIASAEKAISRLREFLAVHDEVTLGIAKETIMFGDSTLPQNNPASRDLARLLFSHGIASITFTHRLTLDELLRFFRLLLLKREQIDEQGGIILALSTAGIDGLLVQPIDYRAFQVTDEVQLDNWKQPPLEQPSEFIWENFVRDLMAGRLHQDGQMIDLDPEVLAEMLNRRGIETNGDERALKTYARTISRFIEQLAGREHGAQREELILRLSSFIYRLSPELRRKFVNSVFTSLAARQELAESVLPQITEEAILEALEELNDRHESISQNLLDIIGKLSAPLANKVSDLHEHPDGTKKEEVAEKLRTIFSEENQDKFLPEAYQKTLHSILAIEHVSPAEELDIAEWKKTLDSHPIEEKISVIILDIISNSFADCDPEVLGRNLIDLCSYFLELGDFDSLLAIHIRMSAKSASLPADLYKETMGFFSTPEFVQEVLNGLGLWGKAKYPEIGSLIGRVGEPFIEPLLDRLAEEQSMSLRRYYMDRLQEIGLSARDAVVARLYDKRWYFVRNLILILRNWEDPDVITHIRPLSRHPHPKVHTEAIRTLLHFNDEEADRHLLRDMESPDHETLLNAVRLSEHSHNPVVRKKLRDFLNRSGLGSIDFELKIAAIHACGMVGDPNILPDIERLLTSWSILRSGQLNRLKAEAVRSLKHYPRQAVISLVKNLAQSGKSHVREVAAEIYRNLQGGEDAR